MRTGYLTRGRFEPGHLAPAARASLVNRINTHFTEVALGALRLHEGPGSVVVVRWSLGGEEVEIKIQCTPKDLYQADTNTLAFEELYAKIAIAMRDKLGLDTEDDEDE